MTVRSTPSRERSTVLRATSGSPVSVTCHAPSRASTGSSVSVSVTVMAAVIAHAAVSVRPKCGTPGSPTRARPRTRSPGAERHTGWYGPDSSTTRWGSAASSGAPLTESSPGTSHALEPAAAGDSASSTGTHASPSTRRTRRRQSCSGRLPVSRWASRCTAIGVHGSHGRGGSSVRPASRTSGVSAQTCTSASEIPRA
ncbi:hypothetical protein ACJ65_00890 [Kocuria rhizophila]|nr:hypothetical protein ACJ65_00890 [Kocuria rhizophila]